MRLRWRQRLSSASSRSDDARLSRWRLDLALGPFAMDGAQCVGVVGSKNPRQPLYVAVEHPSGLVVVSLGHDVERYVRDTRERLRMVFAARLAGTGEDLRRECPCAFAMVGLSVVVCKARRDTQRERM